MQKSCICHVRHFDTLSCHASSRYPRECNKYWRRAFLHESYVLKLFALLPCVTLFYSLFGVYGVPNSLKASALPPIAKQRLQQLTQAQQHQQQQQGSAAGTSSSTTDAASSRSKEHSSSVYDPAQQFMQQEVVDPSSVSLSLPSPLSLKTDSQGASEVITRAHNVTAQAHNQVRPKELEV